VGREHYKKALEAYNVYVRQFPNSIWAGIAGFQYRNEYYKDNPAAATAPTVDFSK
jgi:LemA protein